MPRNLLGVALLTAAFTTAPCLFGHGALPGGAALYGATVIKFDFGGDSGADVLFDGSWFATAEESNASTLGNQDTGLVLVGSLSGQHPNVASGASMTLAGIGIDGPAILLGSAIVQPTSGGLFSLYDVDNQLLLAGTLAGGSISGSVGSSSGSFVTTSGIQYTGGSLLPSLHSGSLSLSLGDISSGTNAGLSLTPQGGLASFTASATGQFDSNRVTSVPEPTTLGGAALMFVVGTLLRKRRRGNRHNQLRREP